MFGLYPLLMPVTPEYQHAYYVRNKEKILAQTKAYAVANRKHLYECAKQWRDKNKEKIKAKRKARRVHKRPQVIKYKREWNAKNRDKTRAYGRKSRLKNWNMVRIRQAQHRRKDFRKWFAKSAVYRAVKSGRLYRPDQCSKCFSKTKLHAHHYMGYDRTNWLTVEWLCPICHKTKHPQGICK